MRKDPPQHAFSQSQPQQQQNVQIQHTSMRGQPQLVKSQPRQVPIQHSYVPSQPQQGQLQSLMQDQPYQHTVPIQHTSYGHPHRIQSSSRVMSEQDSPTSHRQQMPQVGEPQIVHKIPVQIHSSKSAVDGGQKASSQNVHTIPVTIKKIEESVETLPSENMHTIPLTIQTSDQRDGQPIEILNEEDPYKDLKTFSIHKSEAPQKLTERSTDDPFRDIQPISVHTAKTPPQDSYKSIPVQHSQDLRPVRIHNVEAPQKDRPLNMQTSEIITPREKAFNLEETKSHDSGITSRGSSWQSGSFKDHIASFSPGSYTTLPVKKSPSSIGDKSSLDGDIDDIVEANANVFSTLPNIKPLKTVNRGYESDADYISSKKINPKFKWLPQKPLSQASGSGYATDVEFYVRNNRNVGKENKSSRFPSDRDYMSDADSVGSDLSGSDFFFGTTPRKSPLKPHQQEKKKLFPSHSYDYSDKYEDRGTSLIDQALEQGPDADFPLFSGDVSRFAKKQDRKQEAPVETQKPSYCVWNPKQSPNNKKKQSPMVQREEKQNIIPITVLHQDKRQGQENVHPGGMGPTHFGENHTSSVIMGRIEPYDDVYPQDQGLTSNSEQSPYYSDKGPNAYHSDKGPSDYHVQTEPSDHQVSQGHNAFPDLSETHAYQHHHIRKQPSEAGTSYPSHKGQSLKRQPRTPPGGHKGQDDYRWPGGRVLFCLQPVYQFDLHDHACPNE